jgi:predicted permease
MEKGKAMIQSLLSVLPALACPVGMGLLMWLMMSMGKEQRPSDATILQKERRQREAMPEVAPRPSTPPSSSSPLKAIWDCVQMCLNWKVLIGLAVVALLVGVVAPQFFWSTLPQLLVLACPLSMVVMFLSMSRKRAPSGSSAASCSACEPTPAEASQALEQPGRERSSTAPLKW